jgi:hypothetical protein
MLAGCSSGISQIAPNPLSVVYSPLAGQKSETQLRTRAGGYIYVANSSQVGQGATGEVLVYSTPSERNVAPINVIGGALTQLTQVNGIVVDSSGEIYVVNTDTAEIVGFAPGSSGNVSPNVVISGANTNLGQPVDLAIESTGNLYVANCGSGCASGLPPPSLLEFAAGSNGNITPIRDISGSQTQLTRSNGVALDGAGNIFVSQLNEIIVFGSSANGNVPPSRMIAGSKTMLNTPFALAVDGNGLYASSCDGEYIERFAKNAKGNVAPLAVIGGKKTRIQSCVDGVAVGRGGQIYGITWENAPSILGFRGLSNGNVKPATRIAGSKTQLIYPTGIFIPESDR